ncbi:MAG TPA: hypothetical protein VH372_05705 [Actinospica sp.]|nr:hypothetical protein [Actinospica sp.]
MRRGREHAEVGHRDHRDQREAPKQGGGEAGPLAPGHVQDFVHRVLHRVRDAARAEEDEYQSGHEAEVGGQEGDSDQRRKAAGPVVAESLPSVRLPLVSGFRRGNA